MKILKLKIERCGDCPNITFFGSWVCKIINERVSLGTIPLFCPLEDDEPKTCATCRYWYAVTGDEKPCNKLSPSYGCIHHEVKKR